jgi:hypothetical protein
MLAGYVKYSFQKGKVVLTGKCRPSAEFNASIYQVLKFCEEIIPMNRVARGNFTPRPSQIRTGQSPVIRLLSSSRQVLPLEFLSSYRDDRFPRSTPEPGSDSRHLYAGRRPSSKQVSLGLILESNKPPVLTSSFSFRHLIGSSLALASLNLT